MVPPGVTLDVPVGLDVFVRRYALRGRRRVGAGAGGWRAGRRVSDAGSPLHLHRLNVALAEVNEAVLRATKPAQVLERACAMAVDAGGLGAAWVGLVRGGEILSTALPPRCASHVPRSGD